MSTLYIIYVWTIILINVVVYGKNVKVKEPTAARALLKHPVFEQTNWGPIVMIVCNLLMAYFVLGGVS